MNLPLKPFYFIRHGETDWNKHNIIMGSIDIPLNDQGIDQAKHVATFLKEEVFDTIISSPLKRALKTAEIIADYMKIQKPIIINDQIVEREWGEAEGKEVNPTKSLFNDADTPIGGETFSTFKKRVVEAVSQILYNEHRPLIVSHGGVFKVLAENLGYTKIQASNCHPFLFNPPEQENHPWQVCSLN